MARDIQWQGMTRLWHRARAFAGTHPNLTAWAALAVAMVAILLWSAKDVDLLLRQRLALVVATVLLAGACVWIITWEDSDSDTPET